MPSSLSLGLRSRIASAVMAGETVRSVAVRFGACAATAVRLGRKARSGGGLSTRPRGAPPETIIGGDVAGWIGSRLTEKPDLTVRSLAAELCGGSIGDSYDNALAETINGLFEAEVIHRPGPWRSFEAVEYATLEWVDRYDHPRRVEPIGNVPPAEAEAAFYASLRPPRWRREFQSNQPPRKPARFNFETGKNEFGLDHNETGSWHGWHSHVSLSMLAPCSSSPSPKSSPQKMQL